MNEACKKALNNLYGKYHLANPNDTKLDDFWDQYIKSNVKHNYNFVFKWELAITNVIFNEPATIVFWNDGTKTVVKCQEGDTFDKEKGLAMAIAKKYIGNNKGSYANEIKKWTEN